MPDLSTIADVAEKIIAGSSLIALGIKLVYPKAGVVAGLLERLHRIFSVTGVNTKLPDRPGVAVKVERPRE